MMNLYIFFCMCVFYMKLCFVFIDAVMGEEMGWHLLVFFMSLLSDILWGETRKISQRDLRVSSN